MSSALAWERRFEQPPHLLGTLFWLHGTESESELRHTFDLAVAAGIGEMTFESRPHWDYLGPKWWADLKLLLGWCRESGVSAYLFDEKWYPSGVAGGTIQKLDPAYRRSSLRLQYLRYRGPLARVSLMPPWTQRGRSAIVCAAAYPQTDEGIDYARRVDLTDRLQRPDSPHMHGIVHGVRWDVPPGDWIVCFIIEDRADNYIDPLHPGAVQAFVERVYESSKTELGAYFGDPVRGFFFDEPAYFNGEQEVPWGHDLRSRFMQAKGYDPLPYLPALWLKRESRAAAFFAYDFYDFLNKAYADTYCRPIHEWCGRHGLKYIGHWYEHEACPRHGERYMFHERTTEGPGDFFEVSRFADEGGIDLVCNQVIPGHRNRDYWGLPKLGSSAAHVFGVHDDLAMSETFGAYGWHLGLRMMKWLTDWQAVRGINHFILHAFNPRWPDLDCPPYFYDGGVNPQWPYFAGYVRYVNRLSDWLRGGRHVASLLLLYPGALGQAGASTPIEDVQMVLQEHQYDYDLVQSDELTKHGRSIGGGGGGLRLQLRNETYEGIVVPGLEAVTPALLAMLAEFAQAGVPVVFADRLPSRIVQREDDPVRLHALLEAAGVRLAEGPARLPSVLLEAGVAPQADLQGARREHLRLLHRVKDGRSVWFLSNEDVDAAIDGWLRLPGAAPGCSLHAWEPMSGETWALPMRMADGEAAAPMAATATGGEAASASATAAATVKAAERWSEYRVTLPPYRSLLVTEVEAEEAALTERPPAAYTIGAEAAQMISVPDERIEFQWQGGVRTGLPSWLSLDAAFSGSVTYTWRLELDGAELAAEGARTILDLGRVEEIAEVFVNDLPAGGSFIPPYRFDVTAALRPGTNRFAVRITNVVSNRMSRAEELEDAGDRWKERRELFSIPQDGGLLGPVRLEIHHGAKGI